MTEDGGAICKCGGILFHRGRALTVCSTCGVPLVLTLCKYGVDRDYYCLEHCPGPEWQEDYDWQTECARCGIERGDYWEGMYRQLLLRLGTYTNVGGTSTDTSSLNLAGFHPAFRGEKKG